MTAATQSWSARLQWWLWDHELNRLGNLISDFRYWTWWIWGGWRV